MSAANRRALRDRQIRRNARANARLDAAEQPADPTVAEIAEHVEFAGSRRHICLTVPRTCAPRGKRVTLRSHSGPRSAEDKRVTWDPARRAVTACWTVEDLRGWLESIGEGPGSPGMATTIDTTDGAFEIEINVKPLGSRTTIQTTTIKVDSIPELGRVVDAINVAIDSAVDTGEPAGTKAAAE